MDRTRFDVVSPATGECLRTVDGHTDADASAIVDRAHRVWLGWKRTGFAERARVLHRAAELLRMRADPYARLMAGEMGKPVAAGRAEVEKCAWVCDHYAEHGPGMLAAEAVPTDGRRSYVAYSPLGVILGVMPWNFPMWQVFRFAAPALTAGNAVVLKHASNVPGTAQAIESLLQEAGLPEGLFTALLVSAAQVGPVIRHPLVAAVSLTGSTGAGRAVAQLAGAFLKKTVLELGGSDPYVILEDADLDHAVEVCVESRLMNSGQSCIAAKRFVVVAEVYDAFVDRFVAGMRQRRVGDPMDDATDVGPLARFDLRDTLHRQVSETVIGGARCRLGGEIPDGPGAFYPPTVLTEVPPGTPGWDEELFGPVGCVIRARSEAHALEIANDSPFGLGAAVFTRDLARGQRIAEEELDAGSCFVNAMVRSDPRLPFGGIKDSGYGRELGVHGIREFVNAKTVYVA